MAEVKDPKKPGTPPTNPTVSDGEDKAGAGAAVVEVKASEKKEEPVKVRCLVSDVTKINKKVIKLVEGKEIEVSPTVAGILIQGRKAAKL